jgi:hypothetical protein
MSDECCVNKDELREEIAVLKEVRRATLLAIKALVQGAQSYQLDTGQTRQFVTKAQLGSLQLTYSRLGTEIRSLEMQLCPRTLYVRPAW